MLCSVGVGCCGVAWRRIAFVRFLINLMFLSRVKRPTLAVSFVAMELISDLLDFFFICKYLLGAEERIT